MSWQGHVICRSIITIRLVALDDVTSDAGAAGVEWEEEGSEEHSQWPGPQSAGVSAYYILPGRYQDIKVKVIDVLPCVVWPRWDTSLTIRQAYILRHQSILNHFSVGHDLILKLVVLIFTVTFWLKYLFIIILSVQILLSLAIVVETIIGRRTRS